MRIFTKLLPLCGCLLLTLFVGEIAAQARVTATSNSGGAYTTIRDQRFQIEGPDRPSQGNCNGSNRGDHTSFGDHIKQLRDGTLNKNVLEFHSHINRDSDRCIKFDRVRIEVKGDPSPGVDPEARHSRGDVSYYRWQFRLPSDFKGSTNFSHLFQNKATGGDDGFPIITISARTRDIYVRHDAGNNQSADKGVMVSAPIDDFKGKWVEVYMRQKHAEQGEFYIKIQELQGGRVLMEHRDNNLDMWRDGAQITRPKFGIYRRITDEAQDEKVRFASFCSSESSAGSCPSMITGGGGSNISGNYYFRNRATGQYLDSDGSGRVKAGSRSTALDRQWRLVVSSNSTGDYNIDSRSSGRGVLEAVGTSSVQYVGAEPVQTINRREWIAESLGNNTYRFKNRDKNKYLAQKFNSTAIEHTSFNGNRAQWVLERVGSNLQTLTEERELDQGNEQAAEEGEVSIFPNPASDGFNVNFAGDQDAVVTLYTLAGRQKMQRNVRPGSTWVNRPADLPAGIYVVQIEVAGAAPVNQRVMFR